MCDQLSNDLNARKHNTAGSEIAIKNWDEGVLDRFAPLDVPHEFKFDACFQKRSFAMSCSRDHSQPREEGHCDLARRNGKRGAASRRTPARRRCRRIDTPAPCATGTAGDAAAARGFQRRGLLRESNATQGASGAAGFQYNNTRGHHGMER